MAYNKRPNLGQATMANSEPVVIASDQSAVPVTVSGVATAANQTTIIGHVDGLETAVAATNTKLDTLISQTDGLEASSLAIQTAVETIDNAIAGSEMQVDVVAALPAGNNNIGDVDIVTLPSVHFSDTLVTGQGSQTTLNNNVILTVAGATAYDAMGTTGVAYRSFSISITPAAGTVTAGIVTFEGSNDNTNFIPFFLTDEANITASPVSSYGPTASTTRYFKGPLIWRYVRARISTGVTGTTTGLQAFTRFSTEVFTDTRINVQQPTAASLNATVTGTVAVTMAANATTTPAKARDVASGANDTGIPAWFIRRDAPTALTPIAGDWEAGQINALGSQWVAAAAATAGGATPYKLVSAATTNATSVKASAGQVYMITASNVNAAARYLKLYNKASAPTVGTDVPVFTFIIPGNTAGAGTNIPVPTVGLAFSTGIAFALTTEATDAGTTAVAVSEIVVNLAYL